MAAIEDITKRGKERAEKRKSAETALRDMANTLLGNEMFRKWAGDVMVRNGYFDGRELTPYCQGVRGGIVREIERLMEAGDDGDKFLAAVFRDNVLAGRR